MVRVGWVVFILGCECLFDIVVYVYECLGGIVDYLLFLGWV